MTVTSPGAGGGEPAEEHGQADLHVVGVKGGAGVVAQARPGAVEGAADVGGGQVDRAELAGAGGGEPAEEHGQADLQAVGDRAGPEPLRRLAPSQSRLAPMRAPPG